MVTGWLCHLLLKLYDSHDFRSDPELSEMVKTVQHRCRQIVYAFDQGYGILNPNPVI